MLTQVRMREEGEEGQGWGVRILIYEDPRSVVTFQHLNPVLHIATYLSHTEKAAVTTMTTNNTVAFSMCSDKSGAKLSCRGLICHLLVTCVTCTINKAWVLYLQFNLHDTGSMTINSLLGNPLAICNGILVNVHLASWRSVTRKLSSCSACKSYCLETFNVF